MCSDTSFVVDDGAAEGRQEYGRVEKSFDSAGTFSSISQGFFFSFGPRLRAHLLAPFHISSNESRSL